MNRLMPLFTAAWLVPAAATLASTPANPPAIRSQAELGRYLHDTPIADTPLAPLSPGGRKRFLGELKWGSRGLGSVPLDDIDNELTHEQAVRLLALFDAQAFARGLGLTAAEHARREAEHAADAKARHCSVDSCPESAIEQRFDALMLLEPDPSRPDAEQRSEIGRHYDRLFSGLQHPDSLRRTSAPDLRLLQRAAEYATSWQPDAAHVADLQADLAELQRRRMAGDRTYTGLYRTLVARRQFAEATALHKQHPGMHVAALPAFISGATPKPGLPTALSVDAATDTMRRQAIDLGGPLRIVVIAGCHFSEDAARAIEGDPQLHPLFAQHAIWLAAPSQRIGEVSAWNRQFPDMPMHVAWNQDEWSMLPNWDMPTYYVYRNGQLVRQFSGWLGAAGLKQSLHKAGAL